MTDQAIGEKARKERSPSFPFIPLGKAVERAKAILEAHRREAARLTVVAGTLGYAPKSSGLLQTVAALKQFGLIEDLGSGEDRKILISDLGRRILVDQRPGAREAALKEAAVKPRLIAEYITRWVPSRPSDAHCISELHLDRGFNEDAAKLFLRVFDQTVDYAKLGNGDSVSPDLEEEEQEANMQEPSELVVEPEMPRGWGRPILKSLGQRLKIELTSKSLNVTGLLVDQEEVETLMRMLEANKALLPKGSGQTN